MKNGHLLAEKIAKQLPMWAQQHIEMLQRQRDAAVRTLEQFTEEQKPQHFYVEDIVCIKQGAPTTMRRYIHGHFIRYEHRGLEFSISEYDDGVSIQYGQGRSGLHNVLMQPTSFQQIKLIYPEQDK